MAFHTDELEHEFIDNVERKRLELDTIWRFMQHREKALRDAWITPLFEMILVDQPEMSLMAGIPEQLLWLTTEAPENIREALFYCCALWYPSVREFLENSPDVMSADDTQLKVFLHNPNLLGRLVDRYLRAETDVIDTDSFVRWVRVEYTFQVGYVEKPYTPHLRRPPAPPMLTHAPSDTDKDREDERRAYGSHGDSGTQ